MTERLISYSPDMVRAKRAGLKTMTRRICKGQRELSSVHDFQLDRCPYGVPGDILATREAWRTVAMYDALPPRDLSKSLPIWYEADGPAPSSYGRYRHARFMCRWMCRDRDELTAVRVEKLQAISRGDAMAEGCPFPNMAQGDDPRQWYRNLWEQINGPGSWDANPFVWVLTFRPIG